jgi:hypothetical protein
MTELFELFEETTITETEQTKMTGYEFKKLHKQQFYIYEVWRSSLLRDTLHRSGIDSMGYQHIFTSETYFPYYEYYVKNYMMLTRTSDYSYYVYAIDIPDSATVIIEKKAEDESVPENGLPASGFKISKIENKGPFRGHLCQLRYLKAWKDPEFCEKALKLTHCSAEYVQVSAPPPVVPGAPQSTKIPLTIKLKPKPK